MNTPYIFNIQKFSVHDGPGIRTTVFFKGCPLRCQWCHNPESQQANAEAMHSTSGTVLAGVQYPLRELVRLLKKDQIFYEQSHGGITLSGGEVMVQDMDYLTELLKALDREGIPVIIDTCGHAPTEYFERVLPYTERFLYDLKLMDSQKHLAYTGVSNDLILKNLKFLSDRGAKIELRMIMVPEVNMSDEDLLSAVSWLKWEKIRLTRITLLPYHDFGRDKYRQLDRPCTQNFQKPDGRSLEKARLLLEQAGFEVTINQ